jgi:hypothetical protein
MGGLLAIDKGIAHSPGARSIPNRQYNLLYRAIREEQARYRRHRRAPLAGTDGFESESERISQLNLRDPTCLQTGGRFGTRAADYELSRAQIAPAAIADTPPKSTHT